MPIKITTILSLIIYFSWLMYWTGRFYKERYFNRFLINYEIVKFDKLYFMFASWATFLVAISCLIIFITTIIVFCLNISWLWRFVAFMPPLLFIFIIFYWPFKFNPYRSFGKKLLGSKDLCLIVVSMATAIFFSILFYSHPGQVAFLYRTIVKSIENNLIISLILFVIVAFAYLTLIAYYMGRYHSKMGIWFGKMELRWARYDNKWWILVLRNDGKYFLFDRNKNVCKAVGEIDEINGFVTSESKE